MLFSKKSPSKSLGTPVLLALKISLVLSRKWNNVESSDKKKKSQDIVDLGEIVHLLRDILTSIFENN